jgi:hypothetical protein
MDILQNRKPPALPDYTHYQQQHIRISR